ncbi:type I restriction-modification system subunit M [Pseudomonas sp. J452]|uniref:N-6 DNA methylase n=1 Tax=Pseudomonas sp. J452 TaxID=2898441 RepID=UPI0021ADD1C2|nr:class I SAM-dependent DNA methyltransferase [Pseudomonas sp. J452]UUY07310.1 type I restriction-modification system subunit M [Pseudomonas sp. J452]
MLDLNIAAPIDRAIPEAFEVLRASGLLEDNRHHVLALILLKYVTDTGIEEQEASHRWSSGFRVPQGASFNSLYELRGQRQNGERINEALRRIERENEQLKDVFIAADFSSPRLGGENQRDGILAGLLEAIKIIPFASAANEEHAALVGSYVYDSFVRHQEQSMGRRSGENSTPQEISNLLVELMDPSEWDTVSDPCCGLAQTLMACDDHSRKNRGNGCQLFGQEVAATVWVLARMGMILGGKNWYQLEWGNTLRDPKFLDDPGQLRRFDVVISHPPFSMKDWGQEDCQYDPYGRYSRGVPPKASADFAFISHMVSTLKQGTGRMAVLVSHGVLFRGGAERQIRERLIEDNFVDAIISLPPRMLINTGIETAILILRADRKESDGIMFIDAGQNYNAGRARCTLGKNNFDRILSVFKSREECAGYSRVVTRSEVASSEYSLSIARYIKVLEEETSFNLDELRRQRVYLQHELMKLERRRQELLDEIARVE